jgi:hypothetical protein
LFSLFLNFFYFYFFSLFFRKKKAFKKNTLNFLDLFPRSIRSLIKDTKFAKTLHLHFLATTISDVNTCHCCARALIWGNKDFLRRSGNSNFPPDIFEDRLYSKFREIQLRRLSLLICKAFFVAGGVPGIQTQLHKGS